MFLRTQRLLFALAGAFALLAGLCFLLVGSTRPVEVATGQTDAVISFVNDVGQALSRQTVRVLCYLTNDSTSPPSADFQTWTNADGQIKRPANCDFVAALHLRHTQPSGKPNHGPAYWVYATSWKPSSPQLMSTTGNVTISIGNPLVLFNVVASLEWEPAPNSPYVADLWSGLRSASAYLYDLTEGQMAFGPVTIYTSGRGWDSADLRFRAANDYRPSAYVGGIVTTSIPYTATALTGTVYVPGHILLGRLWDGLDASNPITGTWSQTNAFRTLVHEWGHYALFLYDEYQKAIDADNNGFTDAYTETYCTCPDLPKVTSVFDPAICNGITTTLAASAMSFQYTASELWHLNTPDKPLVCLGTNQDQVHGEPDWQTLGHWGSIQGLTNISLTTPTYLTSGPDLGLAGDLFGRWPFQIYLPSLSRGGPAPPPPIFSEPVINLTISGVFTPGQLAQFYPQVYVTTSSPARILYQGTTDGARSEPDGLGKITLMGVQAGSRARVFVDRYATAGSEGSRFAYTGDQPLTDGETLQVSASNWASSLDLAFEMTGRLVTTMTVTLVSSQNLSLSPTVQLCTPTSDTGCPNNPAWLKTMQLTGTMTWTATFAAPPLPELPDYGLLRVLAPNVGELIRWYKMAGGVGPAHIGGNAPLRDGLVMVDAIQPLIGARNRVIVMPAADYNALTATLPVTIHGIVGTPLDLDILLPSGSSISGANQQQSAPVAAQVNIVPTETPTPTPAPTPEVPSVLTFFLSQDAIAPLSIREDQLRVLHFNRATNTWQMVPISGRSEVLNWLATVPVAEDGIYAIGWTTP